MPCNHKCTSWKAKKPVGVGQYASGQIRCDTCQIFMYPSPEHTHNVKTGEPDSDPKNGLACNCCNVRISTRAYSAKYGRYQSNSKSFEELLTYIQNEMVMQENFQPVILRKILNSKSVTKEELDNELDEHSKNSKTSSSINTVLNVLQRERNQIIRKEEHMFVMNSINELSDQQSDKLVDACNKRLEEFETKIAICWPTDKDEDKIEDFAKTIKANGKVLWGVNWGISQVKKTDFPITGYIYHRQNIIGISKISDCTSHDETSEDDLKLRPSRWGDGNDYGHYLHITNIQRCTPFPHTKLKLMDSTKTIPDVIQQRVYVKELSKKNNFKCWVWSVTPENWKILKEKNIWASKIGQKIRDRIRPRDKVIFYVLGTNEFQGIFEFIGDWYNATEPVWSDEIDSVIYQSQIKLESIKIGVIKIYDIASQLKMFSNPDDKRLINLVLKGGGGYPSNNGKPIVYEDYKRLLELMGSDEVNYWKISPGTTGEDWKNQKSREFIGIHFFDFDLTGLSEDELRVKILKEYGKEEVAKRANTFGQIRNFINIKEGDIIVANKGKKKILGLGKVVGPYKYKSKTKYPHIFPVEWYDTTEKEIPIEEGWMVTVIPLSKEKFDKLTESIDDSATEIFLSEKDFKKMVNAIPLVVEYNKVKLQSDQRIPQAKDIQLCAKLQYYCALRTAELLKLTSSKINLNNDEISIDEKNGDDNFQITTIHPSIKDDLEKYLKGELSNEILFSFTRQLLWSYYKKAGEFAELKLFKEKDGSEIEGMSTSILRESRAKHMEEKMAGEGLIRLKLRLPFTYAIFKHDKPTLKELKSWEQREYENKLDLIKGDNYYIITQNEDSKYDDIPGKQYAYDSDKAHYKNFIKGINFIVQTKIDNQNYFVGCGKIGSIVEEAPRVKENGRRITDIVAKFSEYTEFPEKKIRTEETNKKMLDFAFPNGTPNIPPAMLPIDKNLYDEIVSEEIKSELLLEKTIVNSPLIFPKTNLDSIKEEIQKDLLIDDDVIDQIISSLYSGKNILLTGPVGTGKTHLAKLIPKLAWAEIGGYYPQTVTATSDWTTQDVIGGIFPKIKNNEITYLIQKGCVAETISKNWENEKSSSGKRTKKTIDGHEYNGVWLVIDEFNRANIDKAFGQLFTALEYGALDIPTIDPKHSSEKLLIPEDYRIIGTLNTFDKHFLFRLSDALKRRFNFIEILPPSYSKKHEEIKFIAEKAIKGLSEVQEELKINSYDDIKNNTSLMSVLENLYEIMAYVRLTKNLGTALLISMFRFILINYLITKDWDKSLDQALMTNLFPQLESLQYWQIDSMMNFIGGRIHELFRRFDIRNRPDVDRYEEELKTLTKYLKISGKNKNAFSWNSKFRTGEIMRENKPISDLNPWNEITRPKLRNFRAALADLKQEKGFFETEDVSEDSQ